MASFRVIGVKPWGSSTTELVLFSVNFGTMQLIMAEPISC